MDKKKICNCLPHQVENYWKKISGPILDRIDLIVEIPSLTPEELVNKPKGELSQDIRNRVNQARLRQQERFKDLPGKFCNSDLQPGDLRNFAKPDPEGNQLLKQACSTMNISARAYDRILKTARTIADLAGEENIKAEHIAEALQYRWQKSIYENKT